MATGLLSYRNHYKELDKGYYYIDFIVLLMAFMYLCRLKNPEQLGRVNPGEFGRLLGIDRVPESKCLRSKIKQINSQGKSNEWNRELAGMWVGTEENEFYYVDGHIQVYHGDKATLGKKFVSRQKLCLPGIQEFWVNNMEGMPYFYIRGEVNEKLLEMLEHKIIPQLLDSMPQKYSETELEADPDLPRFTLVFDREGYSPKFFRRIWEDKRIAVITYRKNVKENWEEADFEECDVELEGNTVSMALGEKQIEIDDFLFREVRKRSKDGHQTSIITTNRKLTLVLIAVYMFARWTQENFFRYMIQNYDFDKMLQYTVKQLDGELKVNNPRYSKLTYRIKKTREKLSRREAKLYRLIEKDIPEDLKKEYRKNQAAQQILESEIEEMKAEEQHLIEERKKHPVKIKIKDMPESNRYTQLDGESKHFQNILKMICYRSETTFGNLLAPYYKKSGDEIRSLVQKIIHTHIDLQPDYENNKLYVTLYTLPNKRDNEAINKILPVLNDSETQYPGTNLTLIYKTTSSHTTSSQEV